MRSVSLAALLLILATSVAAQEPTLTFVDQATTHPGLAAWRANLLEAVGRRDTAALFAVLRPDILNGFGGDGGIAEFKHAWDLTRAPANSRVWPLLEQLLTAGGAFVDTEFVAPWFVGAEPTPPLPDDVDLYDTVLLLGSRIRVRAAPDRTASILATVTNVFVELEPQAPEERDTAGTGWTAVRLIGARKSGWVSSAFVRSTGGYRLVLAGVGTEWGIRALVAGD
jgi:hypothetical protein